jgi:hypothetical protein
MEIIPKKDGDSLHFGKESVCVKDIIGLNPDEFLKIFQYLHNNGLKITKVSYPIEERYSRDGKKGDYPIVNDILEYVFLCGKLRKIINIDKLIKTFNKSQKSLEMFRHDVILARVIHEYIKSGYKIELFPKTDDLYNPDLKIGDLLADVKHIQEPDEYSLYMDRAIKNHPELKCRWKNMKLIDINKLIQLEPIKVQEKYIFNSKESWFSQADVIFLDVSYSFRAGGFNAFQNDVLGKPIEPKKYRVIKLYYNKNRARDSPNIRWSCIDWDREENILKIPHF